LLTSVRLIICRAAFFADFVLAINAILLCLSGPVRPGWAQ
jgi:hypothetical protein